jgi:LuxR family quorum-sensing system transcriptional regulator CciR
MTKISTFPDLVGLVMQARTAEDLGDALGDICARIGFDYYALTHHVDILKEPESAIRVTNYPVKWADYYDAHALGVSDPVHRASHVTSVGFGWSEIVRMIPLTANDRRLLEQGRAEGIGDGFTIPANVPGEARGSCSFANPVGRPVDHEMLPMAQLAARKPRAAYRLSLSLSEPTRDRADDPSATSKAR